MTKLLLMLTVLSLPAVSLHAQTYPAKPVRIIVATSPGGPYDEAARAIGPRLTEIWGQTVIVDNRPGAANIIGATAAARSAPDGYTYFLANVASQAITPNLRKKLPYDPQKDFAPVILMMTSPMIVVTHPSLPVKSVKDIVALAKARPGAINYASAGVGNLQHLAGAMFTQMANVNVTHVPYKGGGAAINDVLANQIAMNFASSPAAVPFVKANRLRGLGFTGLKRSEHLPDVPTLDEAGLKGFEVSGWYGVYGPRGMSKALTERLYQASRDAVHTPDTKKQYADINIESIGSTPAEFAAFLKADLAKYAKIVKAAGIEAQ